MIKMDRVYTPCNDRVNLLNQYYQQNLFQYQCNGFELSSNEIVKKLIQTVVFMSFEVSEGELLINISFKINNRFFEESIYVVNNRIFKENESLMGNNLITTIYLGNNILFSDYMKKLKVSSCFDDLEEWFEEINLLTFIHNNLL